MRYYICHVKEGENPNEQWRIALSKDMIEPTISWFHKVTGHPDSKKLRLTLQQRYYHSELRHHKEIIRQRLWLTSRARSENRTL